MATPRPDSSTPTGVAAATFPVVRRGADPDAVRAFLREVADRIAELQHDNDDLRRQIAETPVATAPDEAQMAQYLGEETARIVQAAREAANEIRQRAEESAAQMVRAASDEIARSRSETEQELARLRAHAESDALATTDAARDEGRAMVAEAREYREKVLADVNRRRELARQQLSDVESGRLRLVHMFEQARIAAQSVLQDLGSAAPDDSDGFVNLSPTTEPVPLIVPDTPPPAPSASTPTRTPDDAPVAAEDDDAAVADVIPINGNAGGDAHDDGSRSDEVGSDPDGGAYEVEVTDVVIVEDTDEGIEITEIVIVDERAEDQSGSHLDTESGNRSQAVEAQPGNRSQTVEAEPGNRSQTVEAERSGSRSDMTGAGEGSTAGDGGDDEGSADVVLPTSATVIGLYAGELDSPFAAEVAAAESDDDRASVDDLFAKLRRASAEMVAREAAPEAPARPQPSSDEDRGPFGIRDEVLVPLIVASARKVKRVLADEQNEVLDHLRRNQAGDNLPAASEHANRYTASIEGELRDAIAAGASSVGGAAPGDDTAIERARAALAHGIVEPLRDRLRRAIDQAGADSNELASLVRAVYREWKSSRIDDQIDGVLRLAFDEGAYAAVAPGTPVEWVLDPQSGACGPDCEDNSLGGAVAAGEPFPTGHLHPPLHGGCRCLLQTAQQ